MEAGDEGSITCAKTGYSVEMKFHTKSLFGSERNKMEAKMMGPPNSSKEPIFYQGMTSKDIGTNLFIVNISLKVCFSDPYLTVHVFFSS